MAKLVNWEINYIICEPVVEKQTHINTYTHTHAFTYTDTETDTYTNTNTDTHTYKTTCALKNQ